MADPPPVLPYLTKRPPGERRWDWLVACLLGGLWAAILGISGGFVCPLGIPLGFLLGVLGAFISGSGKLRKFLIGALGVGVCVIGTTLILLMNWRGGSLPEPGKWLEIWVLISVLVGVPGLCGSGMMAAIHEPQVIG